MTTMKSYKNLFIVGGDYKVEWMIPWFISNYRKWNDTPIAFCDFGIRNTDAYRWFDDVVQFPYDVKNKDQVRWFLKPNAMWEAPAEKKIWIDVDCEVLGPLNQMFNYVVPNKLLMAEDRPWTRRNGRQWYNSGVVGTMNKPDILRRWIKECDSNPIQGDQETLHVMIGNNPIENLRYIEEMPRKYNVLRLDHIDNTVPAGAMINHWTGYKGKLIIQEKIRQKRMEEGQ